MKKGFSATVFTLACLCCACGSEAEPVFTLQEQELITTAAGRLARNLAYLPDSEDWSPAPTEEMIHELEAISERHHELWPILFRAAADSASKLEQLLIQRQQEENMMELL